MVLKQKTIIQVIAALVVYLLLILFPGIKGGIDKTLNNLFVKIKGEEIPDTNIVLVHISADDIARIGPWPIKRNFYALLINQLNKLEVKKTGLEIFLSSRLVTQSVYDQLLKNEIEKSGKVVLSSVAGGIVESGKYFYTDSLSYPSPKLLNDNFPSGHLNFIKDDDYKIPLSVKSNGIEEKAFAFKLSDVNTEQKTITVNFIASWEKFEKYTFIEFSELAYQNSKELKRLKDKYVLIGISDSQIAPTLQTAFDNQLPGMALHAFALDNLLNTRFINSDYYLLSGVMFSIIILGFIYFRNSFGKKIFLKYLLFTLIVLIFSFVLYSFLHFKIAISFFVLPFLALLLSEMILFFIEGKEILKGALSETEILKSLLGKKESELSRLQSEIKKRGRGSTELENKIKLLKADIEKLKENKEDSAEVEIEPKSEAENFHGLILSTAVMKKVIELIKKAAPTDATILISGESGTGKELAAKAVHELSGRKQNNFIAVNCGALSENLLESELFGHVRGAFTGATADKKGRFEAANAGTIFLDEIGETTENFQLKLLRVLQSGEIEKVGSSHTHKVNVRVVAATNKNLEKLVKEKKFREDLYYRLNVFKLEIPPLRERKEDIESLTVHFLREESFDINLSKAVLQALIDYNWKGNVRELQSVIKRAIIFANSENRKLIQLSDLPGEIVKEIKYNFEDHVLESLRIKGFSHSSITETAKELGNMNRTMISENFRGLVFKVLFDSDFNLTKTVSIISGTDEKSIMEKVEVKIVTFISNIEKDIKNVDSTDFETVKQKLYSKYKNLPAKFHHYLDEIIRWKINGAE
ncbi:MAG: sigma 54-interacting transcriptional regulator [Ignavibacteria bacterium]|nr:sigma 54-interacting transcriptional regulator [Ignavibacteria bacterium]MBT8381032.1 sigma 54-interacting transcriptional regulator [Ignavibacteria bacterium]MBT8393035.1 sigma 54-interacting transcriptional regulator [Ignavibacteria bacterium]NNJ52018.1 sigma 54-interacting transcriptional regulator [Ignavibacteriaceae bacterium]NNL20498.1 sigma 54-interacting transcriptional regulator [Ignavibacteriaceae bacterium]